MEDGAAYIRITIAVGIVRNLARRNYRRRTLDAAY
jgi:hypothetical protein